MSALHLDLLRTMLLIRRFEERCAELYSAGRIRGFVHLYVGEEAVAAGVCAELRPEDSVVSTYRDHGHALARGVPVTAVMAEMFGRVNGCSRGRGGSMHIFDREHRFVGGNAVVGGGLPLALGLALGDRMQGLPGVTACFFGEGAMAEGEFHEVLNLAVLWQLPLLLCCENNRYAMGTSLAHEHGRTDLALRASSYGATAWAVDGMDAVAVNQAAQRATTEVRAGGGPVFLELRTYRFRAHSMYDPDRYRSKEEVAAWREHDPIDQLAARMRAASAIDEAGVASVDAAVRAIVDRAVEEAEAGEEEPVADLTRFLHSETSTIVTARGGPS